MSRRQKALSILKKYQEALADKLADLVIDQEENLMQEADGPDLGFTNDLYDLAEKLRAVSVTLSVIPADPKPANYQSDQQVVVITTLPTVTINDFLGLVDADDLDRAAVVLSHIFGLSLPQAVKCTDHFVHKLETDDKTLSKVMQLGPALSHSMNETMQLMRDLFDLLPAEAQRVIYYLKDNAR